MYPIHATGKSGENEAVHFLVANGYEILETNFRYKRAEVDIIAVKEKCLHFVEVKTRGTNLHGFPEEFVSDRKAALFLEVADNYVDSCQWEGDVQFDVIAITLQTRELVHIQEAFR